MSLQIVDACVNCWACAPLCPNKAIYEAKPHFLIDPDRCTECIGDHDDPQCAAVCPIEEAIVDEYQVALNPLGSLLGIPIERLLRYRETGR